VHMSSTTHVLRLPALHVPALTRAARLPVATVLLTVLYAAAITVAIAAPGQHALAGCAVLAGLVSRTVVRRHRSTAGAVATATQAVDAVLPGEVPVTAPATAA
jgi:hypothetical protein